MSLFVSPCWARTQADVCGARWCGQPLAPADRGTTCALASSSTGRAQARFSLVGREEPSPMGPILAKFPFFRIIVFARRKPYFILCSENPENFSKNRGKAF